MPAVPTDDDGIEDTEDDECNVEGPARIGNADRARLAKEDVGSPRGAGSSSDADRARAGRPELVAVDPADGSEGEGEEDRKDERHGDSDSQSRPV